MCAFPIAAYGWNLAGLVVPVCVGRTRPLFVWPPAAPRYPDAGRVAPMISPSFVENIFAPIGIGVLLIAGLLVGRRIEGRP